MNIRSVSVLMLAAALSASTPLFAASQNDQPVSVPIHTLVATSNGSIRIERGMYRGDVSWAMKYKNREELSPNVWVYTGFRADVDSENVRGCETVVITFDHDKVVDLRLVNKAAVTAIAANLKLGSPTRSLASK